MVLDGAGWHGAAALAVPDNITLVPLPPYAPERNPVERIWLYLRERFLSIQVWPDQNAIINACCDAWNALAADAERITSLTLYPWIGRSRHGEPVRASHSTASTNSRLFAPVLPGSLRLPGKPPSRKGV